MRSTMKSSSCWVGLVAIAWLSVSVPATATAGDASTMASSRLLQDVQASLSSRSSSPLVLEDDICVPHRGVTDVESAIQDFSPGEEAGPIAWKFLTGVARSETFVKEYWQKKPFLIRSKDNGGWSKECFTVDRDLKLMDDSYITGYKTAEILRNGTRTDTWALAPLKENPAQRTVWSDVEDALNGGTIYFNTAGSLWRNLGGLCRLTGYAFGLPPNVNVYCTPPGCPLSVPLHTDKQDVFVFQSQGAKRWRVYSPPTRSKGKDPLSRGKNGDVLSFDELGEPLLDTVMRPGDILYVPEGFPHTTDTINPVDGADKSAFNEASIHLTMGLDANVWCLTLAHMRWSLLQRLNKPFNADLTDDKIYWKAMGTVPVGFLGGKAWRSTIKSINGGNSVSDDFKKIVAEQLNDVLFSMEPSRWKSPTGGTGVEKLPSDEEVNRVIEFFVERHWRSLMETQEILFKDVDARKEETLLRAFRGTQEQNQIMEDFGEFSNNKAFAESFRSRRLMNEQRAQNAMKQGV